MSAGRSHGPRGAREATIQALKKSEALLKEAQAIAHIGYWERDVAADRLAWSEELSRILGLDPKADHPNFQVFLDRVHPDDRTRVRETVESAVRERRPFQYFARVVRPGGEVRRVQVRGNVGLDSRGEHVRTYGTVQDCTDVMAGEELLEQSLSALRAVIESTADGILVVDREEKITAYNNKFTEMWRIPSAVMASGDDAKAVEYVLSQLKEPERFKKKVRELYSQDDADSFDVLEFKDGRIFERYSMPQKLSGRTIGRVWSFRDVTRQRRTEIALARQAQDLARSNADLEQYASVASHDLKEPLRVVASYLQLLEQRYGENLDEEASKYIRRAVAGAARMQNLIDDLLEYSRWTYRDKPLREVDSASAARQAVENLKQAVLAGKAGVRLGELPRVVFVESELIQVFQNLIANGIKFRGAEPPRIRIRAERGGGEVVFTVSDNGIGIEPEYFSRIFQIFTRLHGPQKYPGSGVGLAICKKIVEGRGGRVWVESRPGRGSDFKFTIKDKEGEHARNAKTDPSD